MVTYIGQTEFIQISNPIISQPEWGVAELSVKWRGAATELDDFLSSLTKGSTYPDAPYTQFKLSQWSVDDNPIYPIVTLSYYGFIGGLPPARSDYDFSVQTSQVAAASASGGWENLKRDITFIAPTRTVKYYTTSQQINPVYSSVGSTSYTILSSVMSARKDDEDYVWYGNAPAAVVTALSVSASNRVVSHKSTPFGANEVGIWENEDVISLQLS